MDRPVTAIETTVRAATPADVPALAEIGAATFRDTYRPISDPAAVDDYAATRFTPALVGGWLAAPASTVLLLEDAASRALGYAHVLRDKVPPCVADRDAVKLSRLYLRAEAQGRGLGGRLLGAALAAARALGGRSVWLGAYDRNTGAIAFYARHGFEHAGTHDFEFGGTVFQDPVFTCTL